MKYITIPIITLLLISTVSNAAETAGSLNPESVEQAGLPYNSGRVMQSFSKTVHGGVQHLVAKSADDSQQIKLIQDYLLKLVNEFRKGDFSETEKQHGADAPGLFQLKAAKTDDIRYEYKALPDGGQIHFSSEYPQYVQALHEWFDVQTSEHRNAVVPEHQRHHQSPAE